ncbi:hypothetical protein [Parazoarcus communis]|nr:hypothetical protein [Parazoarcus communis]
MRKGLAGQRLVAVFLVGIVLFNFPFLSLFDRDLQVFGLPLLHVGVFVAWCGVIALMAWIAERGSR